MNNHNWILSPFEFDHLASQDEKGPAYAPDSEHFVVVPPALFGGLGSPQHAFVAVYEAAYQRAQQQVAMDAALQERFARLLQGVDLGGQIEEPS